jgi:hypothetical protein
LLVAAKDVAVATDVLIIVAVVATDVAVITVAEVKIVAADQVVRTVVVMQAVDLEVKNN